MIQNKISLPTDNAYFGNGFSVIFKGIIIPVLLSLFAFYSCFIGNTSLGYLALFAICFYIFTCSFNNILPTMLYFAIFAKILNVGGLELYGFVCLVCIIRYCIQLKKITRFLPLLLIYSITHILSSAFTFANISPILNMFVLLLACYSYEENQYKNCSFMFLLGTIASSLLALLKPLSVNLQNILAEDFTEGVATNLVSRYSGLSYDPNFYTIIAFVSISLLLFDKQQKSWINLLTAGLILYFGLITFSKSFAIIIFVLLMLFFIDNQVKKTFKFLFLCGVAILLLSSVIDEIGNVFMLRFSGISDFNELTTGREDLWETYLNIITNSSVFSLLFGQEMIKGLHAAHNTYIELFFRFGFVGFIVDVFFIKKCFTLLNRKWVTIVNLGIIIGIAILLFNLSAYTFQTLWACLFMVFILISRRTAMCSN